MEATIKICKIRKISPISKNPKIYPNVPFAFFLFFKLPDIFLFDFLFDLAAAIAKGLKSRTEERLFYYLKEERSR